jgi:hypothetical protein
MPALPPPRITTSKLRPGIGGLSAKPLGWRIVDAILQLHPTFCVDTLTR